jgi:hypothetical protein
MVTIFLYVTRALPDLQQPRGRLLQLRSVPGLAGDDADQGPASWMRSSSMCGDTGEQKLLKLLSTFSLWYRAARRGKQNIGTSRIIIVISSWHQPLPPSIAVTAV